MQKCKVTVLKRTVNQDLVDAYLDKSTPFGQSFGPCDRFADGQEFVAEPFGPPEGFCPWAWADIRQDVMTLAAGGNLSWIRQTGTALASCTDCLRPVYFKIERLD